MKTTDNSPLSSTRRGILSMELVMTLPVLMIVLLAILEFSILFYARGTVVEASRAGARAATLHGATEQDIIDNVMQVLGPRLGERAEVLIEPGQHSGDTVIVGVSVPMADSSPDLLWPIGFGLQGRALYSETSMEKE